MCSSRALTKVGNQLASGAADHICSGIAAMAPSGGQEALFSIPAEQADRRHGKQGEQAV